MEFQLSYFKSWKMMLWRCHTQYTSKFGKLSSGHRTGKGQFSFQSLRKAIPKNAQTTTQMAWLSFIELDKAVVCVIRLASVVWLWFQSVFSLMPSSNTYCLIWVYLTLDVGYLFTAAPAKHSHCSLPWTRGISSWPALLHFTNCYAFLGLLRWFSDKEYACNAWDTALIPESGRCSGGENGKPLQYSCMKNPMGRGAWQATVHEITGVGHDWANEHIHTCILRTLFSLSLCDVLLYPW